jgi:hypothetical protein
MKKFKNNDITKQFNKSRFRELTYQELEILLFEYKMDWLLVRGILCGLVNNLNLLKEEKQDIESNILNWIKEQILNDNIPPYSIDFMYAWRLIMYDNELNPNKLDSEVLYNSLINSNERNKKKQENHKTGFHVNQGKFGNRKKK